MCRAASPEDGPREDFAAFVESILARNGSKLIICPEGDLASSTPNPEPSPPSLRCMESKPEPAVARAADDVRPGARAGYNA